MVKNRLVLFLLLLLAFLGAGCSALDATIPPTVVSQAPAVATAAAASPPTRTATRSARAPATPNDGLPTISIDQLPKEARQTIALIQQGGPFPYRQDGIFFENREGLLPKKPSGYYHEYTVVTPGSPDRGARRIITGQNGEMYYTDDHYASFKLMVQ